MTIALVGYGKMGMELASLASVKDVEVRCIIDPVTPGATSREISRKALEGCDVALDFSHPTSALSNIRALSSLGMNVVVGTTGWYENINEVREMIRSAGTGLIWSANFSIGVQIFFRIVRHSSTMFNRLSSYDVAIHEVHHSQKADNPSGTALMLGEIVLKEISRKRTILKGTPSGAINPDAVQISSQRVGSIPGVHRVTFDSPEDTIELKHTARGRQGFAMGALAAAEWIKGKKGFYGIDDMINDVFKGE